MSRKKKHSTIWYMCLNPYAKIAPTKRHKTYLGALNEALRLALETGHKCHVLIIRGTAYPPNNRATWHPRETF
jgi:hypothetical protein